MQPRLSPPRVAPDAYAAVRALNDYVDSSGLEARLLDLVRTRGSRSVSAIPIQWTRPKRRDLFKGRIPMWLDRRGIGALGAVILAAGLGVGAGAHFLDRPANAAEGESATTVFEYGLPNLPGQKMTGVLVRYEPGGTSSHHHTTKGSVVAYMLEGALRSKVNDGPEKVYRAGDSWIEPPGASHSVNANVSATEPATLLAVFVAEDGAELTTYDE
jgi:quercetin dioxygenase-like cupin family protein